MPQMKYKRFATLSDRLLLQGDRDGNCLIWPGLKDRKGYGRIKVAGKNRFVHDVSFEVFVGPILGGRIICHTCNRNACYEPSHLYTGTDQTNADDRERAGRTACGQRNGAHTRPDRRPRGDRHGRRTRPERTARGERNGKAAISDARARMIAAEYNAGGISQRALARKHGLDKTLVHRIVSRLGRFADMAVPQ